jgi:hypothetical protein
VGEYPWDSGCDHLFQRHEESSKSLEFSPFEVKTQKKNNWLDFKRVWARFFTASPESHLKYRGGGEGRGEEG